MRPLEAGLRWRLISGFSLAGVLIGLLVLDGWLASRLEAGGMRWTLLGADVGLWLCNGSIPTAIVALLGGLLAWELITLAHVRGYAPLRFEAVFFTLGLIVGPYISYNLRKSGFFYDEQWGGLWLAIALAYAFTMQALRRGTDGAIGNIATTMFILFYAGSLGGYLTKLRMEVGALPDAGAEGAVVLLLSVFLVKMTDVGAFFTGSLLGRHKLVPWLSPKKTWEGFVGGVAFAVILAVALGHLLRAGGLLPHFDRVVTSGWGLALLGVLMALFGTAGDLAASLLKRDAAVKDSGKLIPGMGGVLDILDSPLLAAPAAWFFWTRLAPVAWGA